MKKTILRYGLIGGVLMIALGMLNYFITKNIGYSAAEIGGYLSIIIALSTIYLGIRHFRDTQLGGVISFGKALFTGMMIALIPSFAMFFYSMIFFWFWGDEFEEWALNDFRQNMSAEEFSRVQEEMEAYRHLTDNLLFQGFIMFVTVLVIGFIIALISSMLLKSDAKPQIT